jgi:hypothetical protein
VLAISDRALRALHRVNEPPAAMVDTINLAAALTALVDAIANLNNANANVTANNAPPPPPAVHAILLLDPFESNAPFDLSTWTGSTAFVTACAALDDPWDGTVENFPAFIISLRIGSGEVRWNSVAATGIIAINGNNFLTHYHSVTDTDVQNAYAAHVDPRAIQNSRAMYKCVKSSITGDLRATIFDQADNLTTTEDGPTLFKKLITFTMVASLQLSMLSFKMILEFDPAVYKFHIPTINTKLNHLFILGTTRERTLQPTERIQHTLGVYAHIKQPEPWAQWIHN